MVYRLTFISDEVEEFAREIRIDADATFYDLHKAILDCCGYTDDQMTSFFLCSHKWEKGQEVTLEKMRDTASDIDNYVMRTTRLSELLEDEYQRLLYVFDPLAERCFFMELTEILKGTQKQPQCTRSKGDAPKQALDFDEVMQRSAPAFSGDDDVDENFYGSDSFDDEDLSAAGLDTYDGNPFP
jgi:hypothetical protein